MTIPQQLDRIEKKVDAVANVVAFIAEQLSGGDDDAEITALQQQLKQSADALRAAVASQSP